MTLPDLFSLTDKKALVTGASRGIGARIARVLDEAGASVTLVARNQSLLEEVASSLRNETTVISVDLTDPGAPAQVAEQAGHVDILVNNAAMSQGMPSAKIPLDLWDSIQALNVRAYLLMAQAFVPSMLEAGRGKILNIASYMAFVGEAFGTPYTTSKAAVVGMTRSLGVEWASKGVCVNALCPGWIETDMLVDVHANEKFEQRILRRTPMRRFGEVEDLDGAVLFLCSPASDFVTGQSLIVDGGLAAGW